MCDVRRLCLFCPALSALDLLPEKKKRLRGNGEEQDTEERGEGREGVSMKALLLGGLS